MASETQTLLLEAAVKGAVDYEGRPVNRFHSGRWRSASFILGVEIAERVAYYGIGLNLISYLTGPLGQSTATAAQNVNTWSGMTSLLPLLGAFVADSFLGRYRTILIASLIYILGLGLLTLSAVLISPSDCENTNEITTCSPPRLQVILFFFSLYLIAVGQGGHKPCVQAFGADQFDGEDPEECNAKSSFFNWWYFGLCAGTSTSLLILPYIQDNLNWGLGFGIPCIFMVLALLVFLLGTKTYRFSIKRNEKGPFARICKVFVAAAKNWQTTPASIAIKDQEAQGLLHNQGSHQFRAFLDKALLAPDNSKEDGKLCSVSEVEEAKAAVRLIPIWGTSLAYGIVFAQSSTFFTKQGVTMDRYITLGYKIPPASLQTFIGFSIILFMPIYDRIFVPLARAITMKPAGITMLQRIGTGMVLSAISMVIAALVEQKRLETALEYGLIDMPNATIPMSLWWLVPQYVLFGVANVFTIVGLQEFFYDQVPNELRSVGISLYLSVIGVGSFLSTFLIAVIEKASGGNDHDSWFADNLNRAHLDYFYWLLAGLSLLDLGAFLYFAKSYVYKKGSTI